MCDYFHWTQLGDWQFDLTEWPDPAAMVAELDSLGVKLVVSVWPSVSPLSENYAAMVDRGLMIGTEHGPPAHANWPDKGLATDVGVAFYDATNPEARAFFWRKLRDNYLLPSGSPPGGSTPASRSYGRGSRRTCGTTRAPVSRSATSTPASNARAVHEGMRAEGRTEVLSLSGRRGRAASGTARSCGRATSPPTSPACAGRSGPA